MLKVALQHCPDAELERWGPGGYWGTLQDRHEAPEYLAAGCEICLIVGGCTYDLRKAGSASEEPTALA